MPKTHIKLTRAIPPLWSRRHREEEVIVSVSKIDFVEREEVTRYSGGDVDVGTETVIFSKVTLIGKAGDSSYNSLLATETVEEIYDLIEGEEDDSSMPEWVYDKMMKEQEERDE